MKTRILNIAGIAAVLLITSCAGDNKSQLAKLKTQQSDIAEKIRNLELSQESKPGESLDPGKFKFVGISSVTTNVFDHYIRVQGKLDGESNTAVFAEVPGTISIKYADVGQNVEKGQVLAQIDDQQYRSQLESMQTQYNFASEMYDKQKRLWDQKIGSEVQYLQSKTNKESLDRQLASLKEQIDKFKIKSPVTGTIEECNIKVGSVVSPDPRSAAYRVVAFRNLRVSAEVSEAYASRVKPGDKVIIFFPDIDTRSEAKVDFVSRYINPVNRTFIIEIRMPEGIHLLKANMLAIIQISDYHSDKSVLVPMNLIQTDDAGSYVYVVRPKDKYSGAFKQPVEIGNTYNGVAEILKGLSVDDRIISSGFQELIDGEYVRF